MACTIKQVANPLEAKNRANKHPLKELGNQIRQLEE